MDRELYISAQNIKKIKKLVDSNIEYGGYFISKSNNFKKFQGNDLSVSVPPENYEIHWHTHPSKLISSGSLNQTGPLQPPSIDDIAQSSYKYFDPEYLMGHVLFQLVFTKHGIYIQEPIPEVLDNFFGPDFLFESKKDIEMWEKEWYIPFKTRGYPILSQIRNIGLDLGGYINEDTGVFTHHSRQERDSWYHQSRELEKQYLDVCDEFGVHVTKIQNWKEAMKNGLYLV